MLFSFKLNNFYCFTLALESNEISYSTLTQLNTSKQLTGTFSILPRDTCCIGVSSSMNVNVKERQVEKHCTVIKTMYQISNANPVKGLGYGL